jgi:Txe/YoeB family toxin of toxin-antitoxin system
MKDSWKIVYTPDALKDKRKAYESGFKEKIEKLLVILRDDPFTAYPPYEKLIGDMSGAYLRRINHQRRLVYAVYKSENTVKIISMWNHHE